MAAPRRFPYQYKLLLTVQPLRPVATTFGVNVTFNDANGHTFFGPLDTFRVAFEDLCPAEGFLP